MFLRRSSVWPAFVGPVGESLPKLDPDTARELFGVYAACRAYWKVMSQCLPPGLQPNDSAHLRQSFDQLQSVGVGHMEWLAEKAKLSPGMQQRIADAAASRVARAAAGTCDNTPSLVQEYRERCAALFRNVASAQKQVPSKNEPTEAEVTEAATKFIISTCYESIDDVSRVSSYARMMNWNVMSADQKNISKPVDSTFFEGWEVDHDGTTFMVSISRGYFKGRPTEVCQVSVPQHAGPVLSRIRATVQTRSIGTNNNGVEITELFELVSSSECSVGDDAGATEPPMIPSSVTVAFVGVK